MVHELNEELVAMAARAIPTPLVDAPEALQVLLDALLENGILSPVDHYHAELVDMVERSSERARMACLAAAYRWGKEVLMGKEALMGFVSASATYDLRTVLAEKKAKEAGLVIRYPKPNELFIDIDTEAQRAVFERNINTLRVYMPVTRVERTWSKRGPPHMHIVVTLATELSAIEKIALQATLGSDPMRELLSMMRVYNNEPDHTIFFERPGELTSVDIESPAINNLDVVVGHTSPPEVPLPSLSVSMSLNADEP